MVSYDTTQIALFLSLVLTVAVIGISLALGVLAHSLLGNRHASVTRHESPRRYHGRLAFHH